MAKVTWAELQKKFREKMEERKKKMEEAMKAKKDQEEKPEVKE